MWLPIVGHKLSIMQVRERRSKILKNVLVRSGDPAVRRGKKNRKAVNDPSSTLLSDSASPTSAAPRSVLFNFSSDDKTCENQITKLHRQLMHCKKSELLEFLGSA